MRSEGEAAFSGCGYTLSCKTSLALGINVGMETGVGLLNSISEEQVVAIWRCRLQVSTEFITECGRKIKVIYPGRMNSDHGADFRGHCSFFPGRLPLSSGKNEQ